ncbi:MAG: aspartate aminotransferase family protein, partial [Novosphingobium sp.]|nr:aspartate aminotransferase family protein [Novosphingobium sp.]
TPNKATKAVFDANLDIGGRLSKLTYGNGVVVRCFANAILGFAPALCCTIEEMDMIFDRVERSLDQLLEQPDIRAIIA